MQRINANKASILENVEFDDHNELVQDLEDEMETNKNLVDDQTPQVVVFDTSDEKKMYNRANLQDKLFIAKFLEKNPGLSLQKTATTCSMELGKSIKRNMVATVKVRKIPMFSQLHRSSRDSTAECLGKYGMYSDERG